jgi:hypothetical protein
MSEFKKILTRCWVDLIAQHSGSSHFDSSSNAARNRRAARKHGYEQRKHDLQKPGKGLDQEENLMNEVNDEAM